MDVYNHQTQFFEPIIVCTQKNNISVVREARSVFGMIDAIVGFAGLG
jgi:hypothetical protein